MSKDPIVHPCPVEAGRAGFLFRGRHDQPRHASEVPGSRPLCQLRGGASPARPAALSLVRPCGRYKGQAVAAASQAVLPGVPGGLPGTSEGG